MTLITLERLNDPVVEQHGYHVTSRYVETFWLPTLGPTAIWLLRHAAYRATDRQVRHLDELGACIGVNLHSIENTLNRLARFDCAVERSPLVWSLRTHLGPLPLRNVKRLPDTLRALHAVVASDAPVYWPEGPGLYSGPACGTCGGTRFSIANGGDDPDVICVGCTTSTQPLDAQRGHDQQEATV